MFKMIRQSLVEERVSALHHHSLQAAGETDVDTSRTTSRRTPAPVGSRIVIKKNSSLMNSNEEGMTVSPSATPSSTPTPTVDPRSRVELLERNLRYIQQQHEITLKDLHSEISRLQEENRDLHFRFINLNPKSSTDTEGEIIPTIQQFTELTMKEPVLEKRLQEVQRLHFEEQIDELQRRLVETEEKNQYLMRTIDQMNQAALKDVESIASPDAGPVLLPDPNPLVSTALGNTSDANESLIEKMDAIASSELEHQNLMAAAHEKQRQQLQEIAKLRAVLREVIQNERLSSTSKLLIRDALANSNLGDTIPQQLTVPNIVPHSAGHGQAHQTRMLTSSSNSSKPLSFRHELHIRRLNLSPPHLATQRSSVTHRPTEQRIILPPIQQTGNSSMSLDPNDPSSLLQSSMSQVNSVVTQQKNGSKFGETTVARRERRTQELQRTRLTRNLYH